MRVQFAILAALLAGCSSGSGPTRHGKSGPQASPRAQAAELNLVGASAASGPGAPGAPGGPSAPGGPGPGPGPGAPGPGSPGSNATPGSNTQPGATNQGQTRPPAIQPGLSRMPGYQPSLVVVNPGSDTLARGYSLFKENCSPCHGSDLKGELSAPAMPMRDLTKFKEYKFGSTDQAIYRTIVYGIPKTAMGNFQDSLKPQQVWDLINFMKSRRTD